MRSLVSGKGGKGEKIMGNEERGKWTNPQFIRSICSLICKILRFEFRGRLEEEEDDEDEDKEREFFLLSRSVDGACS